MIEYVLILLLIAIFLLIFVFEATTREQEKQHKEKEEEKKQEQEKQRQERQRKEEEKIKEAFEEIDRLGGTQYIKHELKTKKPQLIAIEHNITRKSLREYCQKNGTSLNQVQKELEQERQSEETRGHNQARMDTCIKCGRNISSFTKTCPYCGYNKYNLPKKCPNCGNHNPNDSIYCWECGTQLFKTKTDTIKTQPPKYEKTITCPNCKKIIRKENYTYEKYNRCPQCGYNFITKKVHDAQKERKKQERQKNIRYVHPKEVYSPYNDVNISAEEFNRRQKKLRERALENRRGYGRH